MQRPWSEILTDALASFEGGKRWMQDYLFDNYTGGLSTPSAATEAAKTAERFCAYGAVTRSMVLHGEAINSYEIGTAVERLMGLHGTHRASVVSINDTASSFDEVQAMFCEGIKRALDEEETAHGDTPNT